MHAGGRRGHDCMVVGFTTIYAISAYLDQGEVYNIMW
jgi:hypothetical protein